MSNSKFTKKDFLLARKYQDIILHDFLTQAWKLSASPYYYALFL